MSGSRAQGTSVRGAGSAAVTAPVPGLAATDGAADDVVPRLLGFYQDEFLDSDDFAVGYSTIGYGIRWRDGTCITVCESSPGMPPSVTIWPSVTEAARRLDAYVSGLTPRRSADDRVAAGPCSDEAHATTTGEATP